MAPPPARRRRIEERPSAFVCQMTTVIDGGSEVRTRCGLHGHRRGMRGARQEPFGVPLEVTRWQSEVTCAGCIGEGLAPDPDRPGPVRR